MSLASWLNEEVGTPRQPRPVSTTPRKRSRFRWGLLLFHGTFVLLVLWVLVHAPRGHELGTLIGACLPWFFFSWFFGKIGSLLGSVVRKED